MTTAHDLRRRLLIRLAGGVFLLSLLTGILGFLSLAKSAQDQSRDLARVETWLEAAETARRAQVEFKLQVQEWKNILLRGEDPRDYQHHLQAMNERAAAAHTALAQIAERLGARPETAMDGSALVSEHTRIHGTFEAHLGDRDRLAPETARAIDRQVRGQDRPFDQALDALAERLRAQADHERVRAAAAALAQTRRSHWVLIAGTALTTLLLATLLAVALGEQD